MSDQKKEMKWWNSLDYDQQTEFEKEYGIHGHDIGTTQEDIEKMYKHFVEGK